MARARDVFVPGDLDEEQRAVLGGPDVSDLALAIAAEGPGAVSAALEAIEAATVRTPRAVASAERDTRARALAAEAQASAGEVLEPDQLEAIIVTRGLENMRARDEDRRARGEKTLEMVWRERRKGSRQKVRDAFPVTPEPAPPSAARQG